MRNVANYGLFQLFWFAAVGGAARGWMWAGPLAVAAFLVVHLAMIRGATERLCELRYVLVVGAVGTALDTALRALGVIEYPTSEAWNLATVPPFIISLWVGFAMLPRFSLRWLAERPLLAGILGAVGGPLSFLAGTSFGVVAVGENPPVTWGALALEYAVAMPLMLSLANYRRAAPASR